jgi:hypothetical protein
MEVKSETGTLLEIEIVWPVDSSGSIIVGRRERWRLLKIEGGDKEVLGRAMAEPFRRYLRESIHPTSV